MKIRGWLFVGLLLGGLLPLGNAEAPNPLASQAEGIDVREFGAVGDGATDDTAAINAAISQMKNGSTLLFPGGHTFLVTSPLAVIDRNDVHVTGGGTIKGAGVDGAIVTVGASADEMTRVDHIRITVSGATQSHTVGLKLDHARNVVVDNVVVEDDFTGGGAVGILVTNGVYAGHIRDSQIHGTLSKGIQLVTGIVSPNAIMVTGNYFNRSAPMGSGIGLSVEAPAASVRSERNYFESWETGIEVAATATDGFSSLFDHFESCTTGISLHKGRAEIMAPNFSGTYTTGVALPGGAASSDSRILYPRRYSNPSSSLIHISPEVQRTWIEIADGESSFIIDHGSNTLLLSPSLVSLPGRMAIGTATPQGLLQVGDGDAPALCATPAGRVGIGTANPTGKLEVSGGQAVFTSDEGVILRSADATDSLYLGRASHWSGPLGNQGIVATYRPHLYFATDNDTTVRMAIDRTGNVGIGTGAGALTQRLEVNGAARLTPMDPPAQPTAGTIYFSAQDKRFYGFNGKSWKRLDR